MGQISTHIEVEKDTIIKIKVRGKKSQWLVLKVINNTRYNATDYSSRGGPGKGDINLDNGRNADFSTIEIIGQYDHSHKRR